MKVFNTLSNALSLAQAENGPYQSWGGGVSGANYSGYVSAYIMPHLKISKVCETSSDCNITDDMKTSYLNMPNETKDDYKESLWFSDDDEEDSETGKIHFVMNDGSLITMSHNSDYFYFMVDTNGIKGPNTYGRDIFEFGDKCMRDINDHCTGLLTVDSPYHYTLENFKSSETYYNCTTEYESKGFKCSGRLLLEGKMDY